MRKRHATTAVLLTLILAACSSQGPTSAAVSSTLRDVNGSPLPGAMVQVNHGTPVATTASGSFTVGNVSSPYTLTVKSGNVIAEYVGLTGSPTSVTEHPMYAARGRAAVSGTVTGVSYPLPSTQAIYVGTTTNAYMQEVASLTTGAFTGTMLWPDENAVTTSLGAVRVTFGMSGVITAYHGMGSKAISATSGTPVTAADIPLGTPVTTGTVNLTVKPGLYASNVSVGIWRLKLSTTSVAIGHTFGYGNGSAVLIPAAGATLAWTGKTAAGQIFTSARDVTPGNVTLEAPSVPLSVKKPSHMETNVSKTPTLEWSAIPGASSYLIFLSGGSLSYAFLVPGTQTSLTVPTYANLNASLKGNTTYSMTVMANVGAGFDVQSLVTKNGLLRQQITGTNWDTHTAEVTSFTTAP